MFFGKAKRNNEYFLVADLGGTWSRLAIASNGKIVEKKVLLTSDFNVDALRDFVNGFVKNSEKNVVCAALACAGPVKNNICKLTRADVVLDANKITGLIGIPTFLLNDLEAYGYYSKKYGKSVLIVAPGTGLGVSLISKQGEVIPTEEGHLPVDEILLFMRRLKDKKKNIEYEDLLAGKNNILLDTMEDRDKIWDEKHKKISLGKNNFSKLYIFILESFLLKLISKHIKEEIRTLVLAGGIVRGNKSFFEKWAKEMKERLAINVEIIEDEFAGAKGALVYIGEKTNLNVK